MTLKCHLGHHKESIQFQYKNVVTYIYSKMLLFLCPVPNLLAVCDWLFTMFAAPLILKPDDVPCHCDEGSS